MWGLCDLWGLRDLSVPLSPCPHQTLRMGQFLHGDKTRLGRWPVALVALSGVSPRPHGPVPTPQLLPKNCAGTISRARGKKGPKQPPRRGDPDRDRPGTESQRRDRTLTTT